MLRARTVFAVTAAATMLLTVLMSPTALGPRLTAGGRRLHDQDGDGIVQQILWAAGIAVVTLAVIAIIRTFVIGEAENLPSSGTGGE